MIAHIPLAQVPQLSSRLMNSTCFHDSCFKPDFDDLRYILCCPMMHNCFLDLSSQAFYTRDLMKCVFLVGSVFHSFHSLLGPRLVSRT